MMIWGWWGYMVYGGEIAVRSMYYDSTLDSNSTSGTTPTTPS